MSRSTTPSSRRARWPIRASPLRVSFHQRGYAGQKSTLTVRDGDKVLASREITFASDGKIQTENLLLQRGLRRRKAASVLDRASPGEENRANNSVTRLVNVESAKRRILYVEGEPRWEYKFIRRAEDDDRIVQVVSMLRTTENKIYRQGIDDPQELADGFPARGEDLFGYQGLIIGSVEAGYFTLPQQELIREFVDRRGGGVLFLGGRFCPRRWRLGRVEPGRPASRRSSQRERTPSIAILRRWN